MPAFLLFVAALLGSRRPALGSIERVVAQNARVRVVAHLDREDLARQALEAAETARKHAADLYGEGDGEPHVIHLYATKRAYQRADAELTGGRFRDSLAFTAHADRTGHIALQPEISAPLLERIGLPLLTRIQVAHEAVHVACYHALEDFRRHPSWFSEGAATWIASQVVVEKRWAPSLEENPFTATAMRRAQRLLDRGALPTVTDVLHGRMDVGRYDRYAVWYTLFRFLVEGPRRAQFARVLKDARDGAARDDLLLSMASRFDSLDALDDEYRAHVESLRPAWCEGLRTLQAEGRGWIQIGFGSTSAWAWRLPTGRKSRRSTSTLRGSFEILDGGRRGGGLLLGRREQGGPHLHISFDTETGVTLSAIDGTITRVLARVSVARIEVRKRTRFLVTWGRGSVRCSLDGRRLFTAKVDTQAYGPAWGLRAGRGAAVAWRLPD